MQVVLAADVIYDCDLTDAFLECACCLLQQVCPFLRQLTIDIFLSVYDRLLNGEDWMVRMNQSTSCAQCLFQIPLSSVLRSHVRSSHIRILLADVELQICHVLLVCLIAVLIGDCSFTLVISPPSTAEGVIARSCDCFCRISAAVCQRPL